MKNRSLFIVIEATADASATKDDVEGFILEALETWGGQRHPDDPLFHSLRVKSLKLMENKSKYSYWH